MKVILKGHSFFKTHWKLLSTILVFFAAVLLYILVTTFPTWGPYSCQANKKTLTELYEKSSNGTAQKNDPLANNVKNFSDSHKNPNCLFVSSLYNASSYQLNEASELARTLKQQKNLKISDEFLKDVHEDPNVYLEKRIDTAKKMQTENQKNFIGIGEVKESER